jgi:hypothetical protein
VTGYDDWTLIGLPDGQVFALHGCGTELDIDCSVTDLLDGIGSHRCPRPGKSRPVLPSWLRLTA